MTAPHTPASTKTPGRSCCSSDCCTDAPPESAPSAPIASADSVRDKVREGYAAIAESGSMGCGCTSAQTKGGSGGCCGGVNGASLAAAIGYSQSDLAAVPDSANMGLSCGNPTAIASLNPGQTVLDLGSGGGFDAFIAGPKVGPVGRVIGVDMTPAMLNKARRNLDQYRATTGLSNVEFRLGEIEHLPVPDASVDVVLSNCVLNLSPDKPQVWREIARVLKPGGRVAISDLALLKPLPDAVRADVEALIGCIAGAVLVEDTRRQAAAAGLSDIVLTPKPEYIRSMDNWQDPLYRKIRDSLPPGTAPADFITSLDIAARKPG